MNFLELQYFFSTPKILLAPMAGVSDKVYRSMALDYGADLSYTEMVSATGLSYGSKETKSLLEPDAREQSLAVQLFGHDPQIMAREAQVVSDYLGDKLALIDVNMGCPVKKVIKKGEGSALLKEPKLAYEIIKAMTDAVDVAITAKIRMGFTHETENYLSFARMLEDAGLAAVGLHGRTTGQGYKGKADKSCVSKLADALSIPVIASGDVYTPEDVKEYIDLGASGVFFARGSYGNPFVFEQSHEYLTTGTYSPVSLEEKIEAAREHIRRAFDEGIHSGRMRKVCAWYLKGIPEANYWRSKSMHASTKEDFYQVFDELEAKLEEYSSWNK